MLQHIIGIIRKCSFSFFTSD